MKKLLMAFALVVALVGCGASKLDAATYTKQLSETELASVKVKYVTGDEEVGDIEAYLTEEDGEFRTALVGAIEGATLTKAEKQDKIFGTPVLYIDLNKIVDDNYARYSVYETADGLVVVLLNNEEYVNYTVDTAAVETIESTIFDYFTAE